MKTTRIDLEGRPGRHALITRRSGNAYMEVTILVPEMPDGKTYRVMANSQDEVFKMAQELILRLEKTRGTNSMVNDYYRELQRFMD